MFRTLTTAAALTMSLSLPALAQTQDDAAFGERVRAYLMANPEVIMEAVGVLQQREDAAAAQAHLAKSHIWSRIFPYATDWLRLGLPPPDRWDQIEGAF